MHTSIGIQVVLKSVSGEKVIKDLEARFHIDGTTFSDNANETAYREGQRTVVLFLKSMLKDKPKREDMVET